METATSRSLNKTKVDLRELKESSNETELGSRAHSSHFTNHEAELGSRTPTPRLPNTVLTLEQYEQNKFSPLSSMLVEESSSESKELDFTKIVLPPNITPQQDPKKKAEAIVQEFNADITPGNKVIGNARIRRGVWLEPGAFLLGYRNGKSELAIANGNRQVVKWRPFTESGQIGIYTLKDQYFGAHGNFVVSVPAGQYAKAWFGGEPMLLNEGVHVIHDENFCFKKATGAGYEDKIDLVSKSASHIQHGTINIIRVPVGFIAKIWLNNEPILLTGRKEPYRFNSPFFELDKAGSRDKESIFESASKKLIVHGCLTRIMPNKGEVAITTHDGELSVIDQPCMIISVTHTVQGDDPFLETGEKQLLLPSLERRNQKQEKNKDANAHEAAYEVFDTRDSCRLGIRLLLTYKITSPYLTLRTLKKDEIAPRVDTLARMTMGQAILSIPSEQFFQFKTAQSNTPAKDSSIVTFEELQETVSSQLSRELAHYGICLTVFKIEARKMLDLEPEIVTAKIRAEMEVMLTEIAQAHMGHTQGITSLLENIFGERPRITGVNFAPPRIEGAKSSVTGIFGRAHQSFRPMLPPVTEDPTAVVSRSSVPGLLRDSAAATASVPSRASTPIPSSTSASVVPAVPRAAASTLFHPPVASVARGLPVPRGVTVPSAGGSRPPPTPVPGRRTLVIHPSPTG